MSACLSVYVCATWHGWCLGRALGPLELELLVVVNDHVGVGEIVQQLRILISHI